MVFVDGTGFDPAWVAFGQRVGSGSGASTELGVGRRMCARHAGERRKSALHAAVPGHGEGSPSDDRRGAVARCVPRFRCREDAQPAAGCEEVVVGASVEVGPSRASFGATPACSGRSRLTGAVSGPLSVGIGTCWPGVARCRQGRPMLEHIRVEFLGELP